MNKTKWGAILILLDWLFLALAWFCFYYFRSTVFENKPFIANKPFYMGVTLVPLFYIGIHYLQGTYADVRRLYRLKMIQLSMVSSAFGSIILFFILVLDDTVVDYRSYYSSFLLLFCTHFICLVLPRLLLSSLIIQWLQKPSRGFTTLIIGGSDKALAISSELLGQKKQVNHFVGYVNMNGSDRQLEGILPYLGHVTDLSSVLANSHFDEVIIAIESSEHDKLIKIISKILDASIVIKVLPDMYELLTGSLKMTNIYGTLLVEYSNDPMPYWQQVFKRFLDIFLSFVCLIILLPLYLICAVFVKLSSPGPILFLQERIGLNGKPFKIIKFRTMVVNAEAQGPQLSSSNDQRITKSGRFMRKTRLDEFPQFFNVLVGHMSLVGPRPERQFYIDQIVEIEPQYLLLNRVRPGITSWGQVKYGYAENVPQMLDRMKFDLLYINNRSIGLDLKILFYTVAIILKAKGK